MFCYLYVFTDLYDRSIVGSGVLAEESAGHAALLIGSLCLKQGRRSTQPLILHSDSGAVMKSVQMLATLAQLGIAASFSRPRVSNDNPYSESLFRTLRTRFDYPAEGFASLERARDCIRGLVEWYNRELHHRSPAMSRRCSADGAMTKPSCSGVRSCTERPARLIPSAGMAAGRRRPQPAGRRRQLCEHPPPPRRRGGHAAANWRRSAFHLRIRILLPMKTAAIGRTPRPLPLFTAHALSILRSHGRSSRS